MCTHGRTPARIEGTTAELVAELAARVERWPNECVAARVLAGTVLTGLAASLPDDVRAARR